MKNKTIAKQRYISYGDCPLCKQQVHENDIYTGIPNGCQCPPENAGISTHTLYKHRVVWHKKCFEKDGCKCCRYDNYKSPKGNPTCQCNISK